MLTVGKMNMVDFYLLKINLPNIHKHLLWGYWECTYIEVDEAVA